MKKLLFTIFLVMGIGALSAQDSVNITFHVNMKAYGADTTGVFIGGGAMFGGPSDNQMDDSDGDGVYSITFRFPENMGSFYTILNGNCGWGCKELIAGQPCSDPANFDDRRLDWGSNDTTVLTCFQECTTDTVCSPVSPDVNVTFRVDMNGQTVDSAGMFVAGGFTGWGANIPMDDSDMDGIWEATTTLAPSTQHQYKFVNGSSYEEWDSTQASTLTDCVGNFGGFFNRFIDTGNADTTTCVFAWMGCCTVSAAYNVTFAVDVNSMSPAPTAVTIGADWDSWGGAIAMDDSDNDGIWTYTASLPAGPIQWKYVTDGNWETLDSLVGQSCVQDFGGFVNRVADVSGDSTYCTTVIGECCGGALGINDLLVNNNLFVLRPTLASDFAYIDFPELRGETAQLQIINAMGQVVAREDLQTNGTHRLDVRSYAAGLYFVQVKVNNTIGTKKMIVE